MMKVKKLLVGTVALVVSMTTIYAAPVAKNPNFNPVTVKEEATKVLKITETEATAIMNRVVPRGATHLKTELEENKTYYEVTFSYKNMELEGLVDVETGEILSIEAEDTTFVGLKVVNLFYKNPNYTPAITSYRAEQQALTLLEDGKILEKTELGEYNLLWAYRVVVGNKETEMEVILDTETNAVKYVKAYPALQEDMKFITEEKVKEIIKKQVPKGKILSLKLDRQQRVYNVEVIDPTHEFTFEIDALTGKILDYTKTPIDTTKPEEGKLLTEKQVIEIIRSHSEYKKIAIIEIELEKDDNKYVYEVKGSDGKFEYDFEIDAYTGKILDIDKEKMDDDDKPQTEKLLTKEQVKEIIQRQSQYKKITIVAIELDHDDDEAIYEVKGTDGKFEYEFEVDAYTGKILEVDKEKVDDYDDDDDDDYRQHGNKNENKHNNKNHDDDEWDD